MKKPPAPVVPVFVADNSAMNCQLLVGALQRQGNLSIVGSAVRADQTLTQIKKDTRVAVISKDLQDGRSLGFTVVQELRESNPNVRSVLLLDSSDNDEIVEAFRVGARGVFCRAEPLRDLYKCIQTVDVGQVWANSGQLQAVLDAFARVAPRRLTDAKGNDLLSRRELEVCQLVTEGLSNREIARQLQLSEHTVKNYLFHSFDKLGISSRVELILYMYNRAAQLSVLVNPQPAISQTQR
jgi:two-component system, NarL family, nitrate/nitrite response regulator NarL